MLTWWQVELLKTFSRLISDEQILKIKQLLTDYFAREVDKGVDALVAEEVGTIIPSKVS